MFRAKCCLVVDRTCEFFSLNRSNKFSYEPSWLGQPDRFSSFFQIWDTELGGLKSEIVTNKALFSVAANGLNGLLLAAGAERSVRLYDPRAGTDVKAAYTAHNGWVTAVSWSRDTMGSAAGQFASASHDQTVR